MGMRGCVTPGRKGAKKTRLNFATRECWSPASELLHPYELMGCMFKMMHTDEMCEDESIAFVVEDSAGLEPGGK